MKRIDILAVIVLSIAFLGYAWVTFNSPIAFGDEGFYSSMGRWISENKIYPIYTPLWGTPYIDYPLIKVPMGFVTSTLFYSVGEFGIKFMLPFFVFLASLMVYVTFKKFRKPELGLFAAIILFMLPGTVKYGVLNYPENQMLFFITSSVSFFLLGISKKEIRYFILSGFLAGLGALSDLTGFLIFGVYLAYFLIRKLKNWKMLFALFISAIFIFTPWTLRNILLYDSPCLFFLRGEGCNPIYKIEVETYGFKIEKSRPEISTGAGLFKFGLINFMRFGFGLTALLGIFGLVFLWNKKRDLKWSFFLVYFSVLLIAIFYMALGNPRTEDLLRYSLFGFPAIAIIMAVFLNELYKKIKIPNPKFFKISIVSVVFLFIFAFLLFLGYQSLANISVTLYIFFLLFLGAAEKKIKDMIILSILIILIAGISFYGILEIKNMKRVKQFSPGFLEACEWIKKNTPEDAVLTMVYAHAGEYNCYRKITAIQSLPDNDIIRLWANKTSYEHLKNWGIDYVLIEGFTIVPDSQYHSESEPMRFLFYLENSPDFEKIFDNTGKYGFRGGVRIYKVK